MKIAVIGAGMGGMAAAYDLVNAGHQVTIYEAAQVTGGLAAGFKEPHWAWSVEKFYHHWFQTDQHMLGLIDELGLREKVIFPRPKTVMYHNGRFYPFDSIAAAILFPGLGWGLNKARFGLVGLFLRLTNNWRALESITADAWMRKWAGKAVYEAMWEPLLVGKFGPYYRDVNMAWLWARIKARTTRLGTFEGGFQAFCDMLADRLRGKGVEIRLSTPVQRITARPEGGLEVETRDGAVAYDQCLVTVSPGLMAKMAPDLPVGYLRGLLALKSMGAVVMVIALQRRLSEEGYYWYNLPKAAGYPFLALVEHTNFVPPEQFGGEHIVYCGDYLESTHEYFQFDHEVLQARFVEALPRFNPAFRPEWVRKTWLFRTRYAQPVPLLNHSQNIPAIQTPIAGLYFASMSQVYPWDRGTNFAVEIGRKAAQMMITGGNHT
jgi:protoporphyrinogen oxidase